MSKDAFWGIVWFIALALIPLYTFGYEWNNTVCGPNASDPPNQQQADKNDEGICKFFNSIGATLIYPIYWTVVLQEKKA